MALGISGFVFLVLGILAICAAIRNWDWWFRINSAGGRLVHDRYGRDFARRVNIVVGTLLVAVGILDGIGAINLDYIVAVWWRDGALPPAETTIPVGENGLKVYGGSNGQ